ncbi:MAG: DNA-binding protein [Eubacterium sp.]|nr:DNA-binding protein [Eubacterium sp.]
MDERLRQSLLYDFYGELLNEHQRQVFSAAIFDDMSYSELADEFGVSRQAAFDLVRRINSKLENFETKLGLMNRFLTAKEKMTGLKQSVESLKEIINSLDTDNKNRKNIEKLLKDIDVRSEDIVESF